MHSGHCTFSVRLIFVQMWWGQFSGKWPQLSQRCPSTTIIFQQSQGLTVRFSFAVACKYESQLSIVRSSSPKATIKLLRLLLCLLFSACGRRGARYWGAHPFLQRSEVQWGWLARLWPVCQPQEAELVASLRRGWGQRYSSQYYALVAWLERDTVTLPKSH